MKRKMKVLSPVVIPFISIVYFNVDRWDFLWETKATSIYVRLMQEEKDDSLFRTLGSTFRSKTEMTETYLFPP